MDSLSLLVMAAAGIGASGGAVVFGWTGALLGACAIVVFAVGAVSLL